MGYGSCSAIIQFELGSKKLGASVPTTVKQLFVEFSPGTSDLPNENLQNTNGYLVNNYMSSWFDDYDNSIYHFNDAKLESPSRSWISNFTVFEKRYSAHSSPSSLSEDELSPENVLARHYLAHHVELPLEGDPTTLLDSSQNNHSYIISPKDVVEKSRKEHTDQERSILDRSTFRQNFIKDVSTAVEMDVMTNEFVHSGVSVESVKSSKDENLSKSYAMGLILSQGVYG
ncbi:hypothetical protein CQW23_22387 [Capsicum baccatum]|uniref:Uncharacterized protein n=1 Tax=Capsicum baccatum TaxID=33114 RepID=A0A2G2W0Q6_CAPBA|nr:hypothetical protein CQW23_22387 [Capsicum baccatum]